MIRDYSSVLANEKGNVGRRKSVEFDLALRQQFAHQSLISPVPQPRRNIQQRQEQLYQNQQVHHAQQQYLYQYSQYQQNQQHYQQHMTRGSRPLNILNKPPPQIIMTKPEQF